MELNNIINPMLPVLSSEPPGKGEWRHEIKYDGFRGILLWDEKDCKLLSRNGKDLLPQFPELRRFLRRLEKEAESLYPIYLDGEVVILENEMKANFHQLQKRGRLRSKNKIEEASSLRPCRFLVFDILRKGKDQICSRPYKVRRKELESLFRQLNLPLQPDTAHSELVQLIPYEMDFSSLAEQMRIHESEGIVSKQINSEWEEGKRTSLWRKMKNWKTATCYITGMDMNSGYFYIGVYKGEAIFPLGSFINGLDPETKRALSQTVRQNANSRDGNTLRVRPGICLDIHYLEWYEGQLREPYFSCLRFDIEPDMCTHSLFLQDEAAFPEGTDVTHPEKPLWQKTPISKLDYLRYLRKISSAMLPFLKDRALTVIRSPHGVFGDSFYQKNKPDSSPPFVESAMHEDIDYILCNNLQTLIWLGNQLAIEFHIPFRTVRSPFVSEIVFDLDPPSRSAFPLAIKAASILKEVLDHFELVSFIKLSGNKGIQVYIPLPEKRFTWDETRVFTEFVATFIVERNPDSFTIERLKKKRGGRLYVDFVQHAEGKTIIAPYSMRTHEDGLVAAPIYWRELNEDLRPDSFTMKTVLDRFEALGDPFASFFASKKDQPFDRVLHTLVKGGLD